MIKGSKCTKQHRRKLSKAQKGKRHTEETKQKMREAHEKNPVRFWLGKKHTAEYRQKMREATRGTKNHNYGKHPSLEARQKNREAHRGENHPMYGKHLAERTKRKLSESKKGIKNPNWRGGVSGTQMKIRGTLKYKQWRQKIFISDDFTCQKCGIKGGDLRAHHKKSFNKLAYEARRYLSLFDWYEACLVYSPLWDLKNGITLCRKCHDKIKKHAATN